jgi:hypothetical protein
MKFLRKNKSATNVKLRFALPEQDHEGTNTKNYGQSYFTRPTIKSPGPGRLIRHTSVKPAAFIQRVYSHSL